MRCPLRRRCRRLALEILGERRFCCEHPSNNEQASEDRFHCSLLHREVDFSPTCKTVQSARLNGRAVWVRRLVRVMDATGLKWAPTALSVIVRRGRRLFTKRERVIAGYGQGLYGDAA